MARYVSLDKDKHLHAGWKPASRMMFASSDMTVPVLLEELPHLIAAVPLIFSRVNERYELHALLSPEPGRNLFVSPDGRWLTGYIPAHYRAHPFRSVPHPETGKMTLCVEQDSGQMVDDALAAGATPFFNSDGTPSEALARVLEILQAMERGRLMTQAAVDALAEEGLLVPFKLKVQAGDSEQTQREVSGLYTLDEKALRALKGDALERLRDVNALPLAYAQLMAQHRIQGFNKLYELHKSAPGAAPVPDDISGILSADNGTLSFG